MGFRRLFKRLVKPAVMVGIVGTLSVSLIVTTPSNAQAFVPPPVLPVVVGATELALPGLLSASLALHPVGWAIAGTVALGVGLYATKDYWLPYVTGDFGKGNGNVDYGTSGTTYAENVVVNSSSVAANGLDAVATFTYTATGSTTGWTFGAQAIFKCQRVSDGKIFWKLASITSSQPNRTTSWTRSYTMLGCYTGGAYKMLGWMVGGGFNPTGEIFSPNIDGTQNTIQFSGNTSSGTGQHGPKNIMRFGDMQSEGFDPRSDAASYRVETECISPDGTLSTITAESLGSEAGIKFPSCEAAGKGHGTGAVKVFTAAPGFSPTEVLWETKRPTEDPATAMCSPTRPTSGCKLGVNLDGQPCVIGSVECENWSSLRNDPNYSTRLSCQYGPYVVAIDTCNPLERAYEPGGAPATEPNTDGNPATRNDAQPDGSTVPRTATDPGLVPGGAAAGPVPGSTTEQAECFPSGWAMLNPIEWVMKPVGCALDAAFKPKREIQPRITAMQGQFSNKVPISWFGGTIQGVSGGTCPTNWGIEVAGQHVSFICGTAAEGIILAFRPVLGAMLIIAALWPLIRSLFYSAIPILKVNPS